MFLSGLFKEIHSVPGHVIGMSHWESDGNILNFPKESTCDVPEWLIQRVFCSVPSGVIMVIPASKIQNEPALSQTQPSPEAIRRLAYEISDMKTANALKVKLLSPKARLPAKGTSLVAGYDLSSAQQLSIPVNGRALVQMDISISVPKGTYGRIAPRSGLAVIHGITTGAGVIDADYTGPIGILLFNHGNQEFNIQEGDRIAQLILEQVADKPIVEVQELTQTQRGDKGFGSTRSQQINIISRDRRNNKYSNNTRDRREGNDGRVCRMERRTPTEGHLPSCWINIAKGAP